MKILILVISSIEEPYKRLENAIRETWGNNTNQDVKIFYNYGNGTSSFIDGDKIICESGKETLFNIGAKTIKSFELLYDSFEFDYIFRTNLSSYVCINKMINFLKDKPKHNYYAGKLEQFFTHNITDFGEGNFASGCGFFISRDLIKKVLNNKDLYNNSHLDDVSIAGMLKILGVIPSNCPRIDITKILNNKFYYNHDIVNIDNDNYHFRCKTDGDRSGDIEIFKKLYLELKNI